MRFSKAGVAGTLVLAAALSLTCFSMAHAQQNDACTGAALTARDEAIGIGASIDYGNSLQEVALYRVLTGIDATPLKQEFQELSWGGPEGYTPNYDDEGEEKSQAPFSDLLIPAAELEADPAAYIRYYAAQDMLKQSGLRSYRPERGGPESAADWWLSESADPIYREDDFAGWLQAMAASDTFHRLYREAGRAWYRPLTSSWTYFDPKKWDVGAYDDVTALALDKWQREGRLIWATVAFSRMRTDQADADGVIDWFYQLHARVKNCTAMRDEDVLYPLFRFHTLRLLFMRAAYGDDQRAYDKAMALMADPIRAAKNRVTSDDIVATRAALLMAGYGNGPQTFYPTTGEIRDGRIPQAQAWRALRWASARGFDDYVKLAEGQYPDSSELYILNGLSNAALFRLLEENAFTPEIRDRLAESGWLRTYLLDQDALNQRFIGYIADHHATLKDEAKALLTSPVAERSKESLLFLLRYTAFSVEIDTDWNSRSLWCDNLGVDAYKAGLSDIMGPVLRMAEVPKRELWANINYWHEYGYYEIRPSSPAFVGASPAERRPEWLVYEDNGNKIFDTSELSQLGHLPLPRDLLIGRVLDWAKSERSSFEKVEAFFGMTGDQRVAEALHLAILNTRNICRAVGDPHRMSRAAWIVLHDNPLWREWADKTPYWYN